MEVSFSGFLFDGADVSSIILNLSSNRCTIAFITKPVVQQFSPIYAGKKVSGLWVFYMMVQLLLYRRDRFRWPFIDYVFNGAQKSIIGNIGRGRSLQQGNIVIPQYGQYSEIDASTSGIE